MGWSARREGMILEVAGVSDDVGVYLNERADREGKTVDTVACEMLTAAMGCRQPEQPSARPAPPQAAPTSATRRIYGVLEKHGRLTIESAALLSETEKSYIVERPMKSYFEYKHIKKLGHDGTVRPVAFSPRQAVEQDIARWRAAVRETRRREASPYWSAADIARTLAYQEGRLKMAEDLLAAVDADTVQTAAPAPTQ